VYFEHDFDHIFNCNDNLNLLDKQHFFQEQVWPLFKVQLVVLNVHDICYYNKLVLDVHVTHNTVISFSVLKETG